MEPAALSVGCREGEQPAAGDGEHRAGGEVELVLDPGGLVEDEQGDIGEAADRVLLAREGDDSGAVGELEALLGFGAQRDGRLQEPDQCARLSQ